MTTTGRVPLRFGLRMVAIGVVAVGLAGCGDDPPADAGTPPQDTGVTPTDGGMDVPGDVPQDTGQPPGDTGQPPGDTGQPPGDVPGDGPMMSLRARRVVECGTSCSRPLDAVPSSDGMTIFFTAYTPEGEPGVFRVPAAGGAITRVVAGSGLDYPVGITISDDDRTLFVADQTATRMISGGEESVGAVFTLPTTGAATLTRLNVGDELVRPAAIQVTANGMALLISAQRQSDMGLAPALFQVPVMGGAATVVTANLVDPSGVSQAADGRILCHDTRRGGPDEAQAVVIRGAATEVRAGNLAAGYPAGLAYAVDGAGALFAGAAPTADGKLTWVGADGRAMSPMELSAGMERPLGLHRSRGGDRWSVADDSAGENGSIFMVQP